ncbi:MAG: hypothetical protein ACLT2T_07430 [Bilophila wadsworthia]
MVHAAAHGDDYPGGSVSEATGELLLEAGCGYFGNSMADDIPHYWITDYDRRHTLLMLPYYYAMDTQFFMFFPGVGKGAGSCRRGRFGKTGPPSWKACGRGEGSPHL